MRKEDRDVMPVFSSLSGAGSWLEAKCCKFELGVLGSEGGIDVCLFEECFGE